MKKNKSAPKKGFLSESHTRKRRDEHRLRQEAKRRLTKMPGLGTDLGKGFPDFPRKNLEKRETVLRQNREKLKSLCKGIFESYHFSRLPYLGGRGEGDVRLLKLTTPLEETDPDTGALRTTRHDLVIKKFKPGHSTPENQTKALFSLGVILGYLKRNNLIKLPFEVHCVSIVAHQGPFLVMERVPEPYVLARNLQGDLREQFRKTIIGLNKVIYQLPSAVVEKLKEAGYVFPSPDLIRSNILVKIDGRQITSAIFIDQCSRPRAEEPHTRRRAIRRLPREWDSDTTKSRKL